MIRLAPLALALAAAGAPLVAAAQPAPTQHEVERREARADRHSYRNCRA
ncbi:MAG: hypothetical protein INR64_13555, partial [Caulobacteraceae bacterium]|nr:hypothetical protein [Caulobacter sp.]